MSGAGRLLGVGVGPGDPELLTLRAVRALGEADVVAHFAKAGRPSQARAVVERFLKPDVAELPLLYPVTTELSRHDPAYGEAIRAFFDGAAREVERELAVGRTVVVLSEGDPLFYGSYMHLHARLGARYPTEVVPGVTSLSGCWSAAGLPIAQGDDVLSVVPATLPEHELARRLVESDAVAVIKLGRNLAKVRRALRAARRLDDALYVERGTLPGSAILALREKPDDRAPYFALVLVPGWTARP